MLALTVQQGAVQRTLSLPAVPDWPLIALEYHNFGTFTPGRNWEHQLDSRILATPQV